MFPPACVKRRQAVQRGDRKHAGGRARIEHDAIAGRRRLKLQREEEEQCGAHDQPADPANPFLLPDQSQPDDDGAHDERCENEVGPWLEVPAAMEPPVVDDFRRGDAQNQQLRRSEGDSHLKFPARQLRMAIVRPRETVGERNQKEPACRR